MQGFSGFAKLSGAGTSSWATGDQAEKKSELKSEDVKTGEEEEKNVLMITTAKLFKVSQAFY